MKLPIYVNGKRYWMDLCDYEREKKWREEGDRRFPNRNIKSIDK